MRSRTEIYLIAVAVLMLGALVVFRILVRRDYQCKGRLTLLSSFLEFFICLAYACVPYIYNPPCWPYVWACEPDSPRLVAWLGYLVIGAGVVLGFGAMFWFGIRRSFGRQVTDLIDTGLYRYSRNPQVLGGFLLASGVALLWPSWYALGWAMMWFAMFHLMVLTEEEHLLRLYGEKYALYCKRIPRYLGKM